MLRPFVSHPVHDDVPLSWVRYARDGRIVARGRDVKERWPADPDVEVVLAAAQVRIVALALPPMPAGRLRQAVQFALEDQVASAAQESAIAIALTGDRVLAAIATSTVIASIKAMLPRVSRIVPESSLARPTGKGWHWYESAGGGGFVVRDDASAFAVGAYEGRIPAELAAALAATERAGTAPDVVRSAVLADAAALASASQATGVRFVAAPAWRWEEADDAAFACAPDFVERPQARAPVRGAGRFRAALVLAGLALALHLGGLLTQWAWLSIADWRISRTVVREAQAAGIADVTSAAAATRAVMRDNRTLRHRAAQATPEDALPLLARAAPAVSALPPNAVKSMTYANAAWTLELTGVDAEVVSRVARALDSAGVRAIAAPVSGGTRMRLTLDVPYR
jgi:hypothetical protein